MPHLRQNKLLIRTMLESRWRPSQTTKNRTENTSNENDMKTNDSSTDNQPSTSKPPRSLKTRIQKTNFATTPNLSIDKEQTLCHIRSAVGKIQRIPKVHRRNTSSCLAATDGNCSHRNTNYK